MKNLHNGGGPRMVPGHVEEEGYDFEEYEEDQDLEVRSRSNRSSIGSQGKRENRS